MKKVIFISLLFFIATGCNLSYRAVDLGKLTVGMTKAQVRNVIGAPERTLVVNQSRDGYQEVLQYRTPYNEVYALEFWDDYLVGYEHLYDDVIYAPAPAPPVVRPPFGKPIYPGYKPPKPNKPGKPTPVPPNRPTPNPPNEPHRPDRPNSSTRPGNRPGVSSPSENTRPSTRPSSGGSENSNTRPNSNRSNSTR